MERMVRWIGCATLILVAYASIAQCADYRTVSAKISAIDKFHSSIVVRWLANAQLPKYEEVILKITSNTKIVKKTRPIKIDGLNVGDNVTVKFDVNTADFPVATLIMVNT